MRFSGFPEDRGILDLGVRSSGTAGYWGLSAYWVGLGQPPFTGRGKDLADVLLASLVCVERGEQSNQTGLVLELALKMLEKLVHGFNSPCDVSGVHSQLHQRESQSNVLVVRLKHLLDLLLDTLPRFVRSLGCGIYDVAVSVGGVEVVVLGCLVRRCVGLSDIEVEDGYVDVEQPCLETERTGCKSRGLLHGSLILLPSEVGVVVLPLAEDRLSIDCRDDLERIIKDTISQH